MLLEERVNAKLLQYKLKRLGIAVSLWEIFALFEFVNMRFAKMSYEPQRYHYVMFEHLYKAMTASDYKADMLNIEIEDLNKKGKKGGKKDTVKKTTAKISDDEEALSVAKDLNPGTDETENEQPVKPEENSSKKEAKSSSSSSSSSEKSDSDSDISDDSLCVSERDHRRMKKRDAKLAKLTYHQVKHIFSIDVKQLKNIPVLGKFIKDAKDLQAVSVGAHKEEDVEDEDFVSSSYIQNVAVKYSFPLDEDEILESDYIKKVQESEPAS